MRYWFIVGLLISALPGEVLAQAGGAHVVVFYVENDLAANVPAEPVKEWTADVEASSPHADLISVDTRTRFQTMAGVGAAFSEIGTLAALSLPDGMRHELLEQLFDAKTGAGFSMCRLPVGSSDFGVSAYSYDDSPGDYEMKHFSLARDEASIIPVARQARQINRDLMFFASPWSPPGWMKSTGRMDHGGKDNYLINDEKTYRGYALYFQKYLQGYAADGVPIARLCPQNEMDCDPGYPGCLFPPERFVRFITQYLGPQLKAANVSTEIWAGTFRESAKTPWATQCMKSDAFRATIGGLGIQYFSAAQVQVIAKGYPGTRFMFTEAACYGGNNTAGEAQTRMSEMALAFNNGCDAYAYWNMMLNEYQKSGWGWKQNSLVTIDRATHAVCYNPDYQPVYLVSRFVRPGDVRVGVQAHKINGSRFGTPLAAFLKPDGTVMIIAQNKGNAAVAVDLKVDGKPAMASLPAHSDCVIEFGAG